MDEVACLGGGTNDTADGPILEISPEPVISTFSEVAFELDARSLFECIMDFLILLVLLQDFEEARQSFW